jgi:4-nitrophenyl phosphatase
MPKEKKVYVIGQAGLEEELDNLGIARCGGTVCSFILCEGAANIKDPEDRVFIESMDWSTIKPDPDVGAVLCGFDAYVSKCPYALAQSRASIDNKITRNTARHTLT